MLKECYETIQSALADLESGKSKAVYLKSLELQAIAFFVANHEDVGYEYAKDYVLIVDPLFECMQESQKWRNKVELLRQKFVLYEDSFEQQLPIEDVNLKDIAEKEQKVAESEITV